MLMLLYLSRQYIKENVLSIFAQTYIDTTYSIVQFLGRNQNRDSDEYVYVRYGKNMNKYSIPNNWYVRYLNLLWDSAWNEWKKLMYYYVDSVMYDLVNTMMKKMILGTPPENIHHLKQTKPQWMDLLMRPRNPNLKNLTLI